MTQPPVQPAPPYQPPPPPVVVPLSPADERTWAMLAHLSVLLNLVTGIIGPLAALVIYLVYKERSRYVAYQSLQSLLMQLILWVGGGIVVAVAWTVTGLLSAVVVGICCVPIAFIISAIPLVAIVYGVIGAVLCNQGQDFRYWLIGDWVRSTYTG